MVSAVKYFATRLDQDALLDYLGEPKLVSLHSWPVLPDPPVSVDRATALMMRQVMVVNAVLGEPRGTRPGDPAMEMGTKAGVLNRLNWQRLGPTRGGSLVDSNASPVLLWTPGLISDSAIHVSAIGSQADSMAAVSAEYEKWVNRVIGWVRRKGTKVWGLERERVRPDLDIQVSFVNNIYALPDSLRVMESGARGVAN